MKSSMEKVVKVEKESVNSNSSTFIEGQLTMRMKRKRKENNNREGIELKGRSMKEKEGKKEEEKGNNGRHNMKTESIDNGEKKAMGVDSVESESESDEEGFRLSRSSSSSTEYDSDGFCRRMKSSEAKEKQLVYRELCNKSSPKKVTAKIRKGQENPDFFFLYNL